MTKSKQGGGGLRDRIKARGLPRTGKEIEVPEWGETVYVYEPTVAEAQEMASLSQAVDEGGSAVAKNIGIVVDMLVQRLKDEDGQRIFGEDDRDWLMSHPMSMITRLSSEALKIEGTEEEESKND